MKILKCGGNCISLWTDAAVVMAGSLHLEFVLKTPRFIHQGALTL